MEKRAMSKELIDLGNRIRDYRLEAHLSQEMLAEKAGISANTVSRIEGGQTAMSIETFRKLIRILGVDANVLLGEKAFKTEGVCQFEEILYRACHLKKGEQEVVLQTMSTLIDRLRQCR